MQGQETPLLFATQSTGKYCDRMVAALLAAGSKRMARTTSDYTAIHYLSSEYQKSGFDYKDDLPILERFRHHQISCSRSAKWAWGCLGGGCNTLLFECQALYLHTGLVRSNICICFFFCCFAATQLARQVHQERLQLVYVDFLLEPPFLHSRMKIAFIIAHKEII